MTQPDFAHSRQANAHRAVKASRLRVACYVTATMPAQLRAAIEAPDEHRDLRLAVRKAAGIDRDPSQETWAAALALLERDPPRLAADWPDDPCHANEAGVLLEFDGAPVWPCPHGRPGYVDDPAARAAAAGAACSRGAVGNADAAMLEEFADVLRTASAFDRADGASDQVENQEAAPAPVEDPSSWW